ncbi:MAG: hypothetical protein DHS20C15_10070 [Planctomycetota bacterium]|nr:MAG: hypothetical protein DHS20C15_10070 [Planctomycetota bacterium]
MSLQRLQKVMAGAGVGSRRACETLIAEGRVEVDGKIVDVPGTQIDPARAEIRVDGERVRLEKPHYYLLNKPRGVICSARARPDTPKAMDYAPPEASDIRLFTIGRLDVESEGAIILTNDGELCHLVTHPRFGIQKTYRVEVDGLPDDATLEKMRKGVWLAEGRTAELDVSLVARKTRRSVLEIKLREGMKREIRRVCARHGHEVRRLKRVAIGPVRLGNLNMGATRELTPSEIAGLRESADVVVRLGGNNPRRRNSARARGAAPRTHRHTDASERRPHDDADLGESFDVNARNLRPDGDSPSKDPAENSSRPKKPSSKRAAPRGKPLGEKSSGARGRKATGKSGGKSGAAHRGKSGGSSGGARGGKPGAKRSGARKSPTRGPRKGR